MDDTPLAGPPDPWASTDTPSHRDGPPFHMTEMIEAEPRLARRVVARLADPDGAAARLAVAVHATAAAGRPIVVVGCGTSEHGALGVADILRDALASVGLPATSGGGVGGPGVSGVPVAVQAFEAALDIPRHGLVIGVSHEGATAATNAAMEAARDAGCRVALITVSDRSPGAAFADEDLVVTTDELDQSWCHTVGYLSPLLAGVAIGGHITKVPVDAGAISALLATGASRVAPAERIAAALTGATQLIVIGSGSDRTAARELVLKVEEASWLPSAMRDLETFLHGHLPSMDDTTGLVLMLTERRGRDARVARARQALAAARELGIRASAILSADAAAALETALTPAGRIVVPESPDLPAPVAALLATATPLQLLTERIARARGTNPDPIRRDDPRYRAAADAAG